MKKKQKKKWLIRLLVVMVAELVLVAGIVVVFDPFYQYHKPWFGMEAVLNDRDNQVPGTLRNFEYDSVILGSSVSENFDSAYLDGLNGTETLKIIRASGSTADLLYYLEQAHEYQDLKKVFWCLDLFALNADTQVTLTDDSVPRYLHTKTALDDVTYLYNKEILFEKIPYMLACSMQGINTGGHAYDWSRGKDFSVEGAMRAYDRPDVTPDEVIEQKDLPEQEALVRANLDMIVEEVNAHPEIAYYFIIPPYSLLWWDCAYVNGELDMRMYILETALPILSELENAQVYFFQAEEDIVCDLDNYMDMIHYSPEINQYMLECVVADENRVTMGNVRNVLENMCLFTEHIFKEEIYRYYPLTK